MISCPQNRSIQSNYFYTDNIDDGFNRLMVPGYAAWADDGSVEEIAFSAGSDLILTYCGGKAIKIGWQGLRYVGAKFVSTLRPKTTKITWGLWEDLPKTTYKGRTYAKIGKHYYSHHAVDYMPPENVRIKLGIPEEQELRCYSIYGGGGSYQVRQKDKSL